MVNVMLSLMSVMSPPPALCNLSLRTVVKLCTFLMEEFVLLKKILQKKTYQNMNEYKVKYP